MTAQGSEHPARATADVMIVAMDIVDFLEARIAEQESAIRERSFVLGIPEGETGTEDKSSLREPDAGRVRPTASHHRQLEGSCQRRRD